MTRDSPGREGEKGIPSKGVKAQRHKTQSTSLGLLGWGVGCEAEVWASL